MLGSLSYLTGHRYCININSTRSMGRT